jgi:hypothetical protein
MEFTNIVGELRFFKARWLPNINLFLYVPVQESTLHIYLIQLESFEAVNAKRILVASRQAIGAKVSS